MSRTLEARVEIRKAEFRRPFGGLVEAVFGRPHGRVLAFPLCYGAAVADSIRRKRVAGTIRKQLSAELSREVADPRLAALSIQEVEVTGDLSIAKIQVRLMFGGDEPGAREGAMHALSAIAPGLRSSLSPVLRMRNVPELRFVYDEGADHRARIDDVLAEIRREDEEKRRALTPGDPEDSED